MEDGNLNFALGVVNSIPLLGSTFNGLLTPQLYGDEDDPHLGRALFMGFFLILVCYLCLLVLVSIDYKADMELDDLKREKAEKIIKKFRSQNRHLFASFTEDEIADLESDFDETEEELNKEDFRCSDIKTFGLPYWLNAFICMLI